MTNKNLTISQIANHNRASGKKSGVAFFSKENMEMFNDKLSNYRIISESPTGCVLLRKTNGNELFYDKITGRVSRI